MHTDVVPGQFKVDEETKDIVRIQPEKHNVKDEVKLKQVLSKYDYVKRETELLKRLRICNVCPLGAKVIEKKVNRRKVSFSIPAKCALYEKDKVRCALSLKSYCYEMKNYFDFGEYDVRRLTELVAYKILSAAEINKQMDLVTEGRVRLPTLDAYDKAGKLLTDLNKQLYGEKVQSTNININLTDAIVQAYQKRKEVKDGGEKSQ